MRAVVGRPARLEKGTDSFSFFSYFVRCQSFANILKKLGSAPGFALPLTTIVCTEVHHVYVDAGHY